ncbi:hypothetical protein JCM33374_g5514 [Metschnikowia sp. JCM 33374]|nr:hypothetical protein JCM33374_g5514 [Metschnikowia sp. JCM 33374]
MAPASVHTKQTKNRRRKKRRTEDFSSDSDSDSSSSSESGTVETTEKAADKTQDKQQPHISIDDMDIASDTEEKAEEDDSHLSREIQEKVDSIKFTTTQNQSLAEAKETIQKDRQALENNYLAYMASNFSDDLDQLRKKPDFTGNSIVLLAKTLQSGSNMFDSETLDALLKE